MWAFTVEGFYSVVQKDCAGDEVLVRTRQKSDLLNLGERLGVKLNIEENAGTDYRFRAIVNKTDWAFYLADAADEIEYRNFKNTVSKKDVRRRDAYQRCWEALFEWQESSRRRKGR